MANPVTPNDAYDPSGCRVLIVDDNAEGCRALSKFLEISGFAVTVAADGASALAALRNGRPPDFLLTDLMLPDLDGLEVARRARELRPAPRIALITGWSMEDQAPEAVRGIDWVFPKPLNVRALVETLRNSAPRSEGQRES